ncbi:protein of unknown function DUF88 [Caldithrix abyssi DSM 13497]|nr:protein of unknown function DUF88 [Caldithrix abyssi DSM 13497]
MVFVDGSNLLIELSKFLNINFRADKPPLNAIKLSSILVDSFNKYNQWNFIRKYWFSSYQGDDKYFYNLKKKLRENDFEPILFKRKNKREKGVDIALTKEMLINAFNQNFDIGLMIAGDEYYTELVFELKRYGPKIYGSFFEKYGLSDNLKLSFDKFYPLDDRVDKVVWQKYIYEIKEELK